MLACRLLSVGTGHHPRFVGLDDGLRAVACAESGEDACEVGSRTPPKGTGPVAPQVPSGSGTGAKTLRVNQVGSARTSTRGPVMSRSPALTAPSRSRRPIQ